MINNKINQSLTKFRNILNEPETATADVFFEYDNKLIYIKHKLVPSKKNWK